MAGRTIGPRNNPNRVLIAIDPHLEYVQKMPAALALLPKPLTAPREEIHRAGFTRFCQRLDVHMPDHQYRTIANIGHDNGQQSVGIEFRIER